MKNKTDLANIARSESSITECALYTLSLKRSEDASASGAIKHPQVGQVEKATQEVIRFLEQRAE